MTQEEKQLLLNDLCARLPYGVKFKADNEEYIREIHYIKNENVYIREYRNLSYWIDIIKPYLRPMSSMTEEEHNEYLATKRKEYKEDYPNAVIDTVYYEYFDTYKTFDWLNKHHFDYRGLLNKGLALEAPEDMYH